MKRIAHEDRIHSRHGYHDASDGAGSGNRHGHEDGFGRDGHDEGHEDPVRDAA
jgi:hypothetical protein